MRGNVLIVVELAVGERSVREKDNGVAGRSGDLVGAGKLGVGESSRPFAQGAALRDASIHL
jgi:hypothetical protein